MNHLTEEQFVLYHYGDTADRAEAAALEEHLHACAECQADLAAVRRTLDAVDALEVPERSDAYGADVWARVQPHLGTSTRTRWQAVAAFFSTRGLVLAGGVAALVLAAFVAGRYLPRQPAGPAPVSAKAVAAGTSQQTAADREQVRERILLVAVGDHLDRSQVALIELVNAPSGAKVDISDEQRRARDLVSENRLYRQTALTTGEPGVASVLDDLERVLIEIANSPSTMTAAEFAKLRERIERQGIIFKVRVFGERVRERETRSVTNPGIRG